MFIIKFLENIMPAIPAIIPAAVGASNVVKVVSLAASLNPVTAVGISVCVISVGIFCSIRNGTISDIDINSEGLKASFYPPPS